MSRWGPITVRVPSALFWSCISFVVLCGLLWLRSLVRDDAVIYQDSERHFVMLGNRPGSILLSWGKAWNWQPVGWHVYSNEVEAEDPSNARPVRFWSRLGFDYHQWVFLNDYESFGGGRTVVVPFWLIMALSGAWPAARVARGLRVAARRRAGCCGVCGYDLRATPQRCPECGAGVGPGVAPTAAVHALPISRATS